MLHVRTDIGNRGPSRAEGHRSIKISPTCSSSPPAHVGLTPLRCFFCVGSGPGCLELFESLCKARNQAIPVHALGQWSWKRPRLRAHFGVFTYRTSAWGSL